MKDVDIFARKLLGTFASARIISTSSDESEYKNRKFGESCEFTLSTPEDVHAMFTNKWINEYAFYKSDFVDFNNGRSKTFVFFNEINKESKFTKFIEYETFDIIIEKQKLENPMKLKPQFSIDILSRNISLEMKRRESINKALGGKYYSIVDIYETILVSSKFLNLYEKKCKIHAMTKNYFVVSYDVTLDDDTSIKKYLTLGIEDINSGLISVKKTF